MSEPVSPQRLFQDNDQFLGEINVTANRAYYYFFFLHSVSLIPHLYIYLLIEKMTTILPVMSRRLHIAHYMIRALVNVSKSFTVLTY